MNIAANGRAIFRLLSLGVVTNRDQWVYDDSVASLLSARRAPIGPRNRSHEIGIRGHTKSETPVTLIRNQPSRVGGMRTEYHQVLALPPIPGRKASQQRHRLGPRAIHEALCGTMAKKSGALRHASLRRSQRSGDRPASPGEHGQRFNHEDRRANGERRPVTEGPRAFSPAGVLISLTRARVPSSTPRGSTVREPFQPR